MRIEYTENVSEEIETQFSRGLEAYEKEHHIGIQYRKFAFLIRQENSSVLGGIIGYTAFREVYIDDIWIDKLYRGKGYGRQLLQAVEQSFKQPTYDNINLVTNEFQAPDFYKKCGFELEFVRKNKTDSRLNKYFFIRYL